VTGHPAQGDRTVVALERVSHTRVRSSRRLLHVPERVVEPLNRDAPGSNAPKTSIEPEAANLGLVRPPFVYLGAIAIGLAIHAVWPAHIVRTALGMPLGVILALAAVAVFVTAGRRFRAAGTPVPGNRPTTTIVRTGPYRFSRNPIYLAFSLLHLAL